MVVPAIMRQLYRETAELVAVMKGAQMGVSEWVLDIALHTADTLRARRGTSLYVQPGGANVGDFVQGRVSPIIEASPYLSGRVPEAGTKSPNKVGLRQIGPGLTYWRTAHVKGRGNANRSGLKSVPVDTLILDEFDEMPEDTLALAGHRLDSSRDPWTRVISTPTYPGAGIEPLYLAGDRRRYFLRCPECDTEQALEWDRNVEKRGGTHVRVCTRCRESIEPLIEAAWHDEALGEWRATNPEGEHPSYHISQLYRPRVDLDAIAAALESSDLTKRQEAYNQHLGLPYSPPGGQLSLEELQRASSGEYTMAEIAGVQGCLLGVDVGVKLHCWLEWISDRWGGEPQRYMVGAYELDHFEEVDELMQRFGVQMAVVDARPELRHAQALQQRFPGRVYLAEYVEGRLPPLIIGPDEPDPKRRYHVQVERTAAMDAAAANLRDGNVVLPRDAESVPGLFAQLQAPVRLLKTDARGTTKAVYDEGAKADHFYHAAVYADLALYVAQLMRPRHYVDTRQFRSSLELWEDSMSEPVTGQTEQTRDERLEEAGRQFYALMESLPVGVNLGDLLLSADFVGYERVGGRYNEMRDLRPEERTLSVRRSRLYRRRNPLVDRAIDMWTEMCFAQPWSFVPTEQSFQQVIDDFMRDRRNHASMSWMEQQDLSRDLLTDGEVPFVYYVGERSVTVRTMDPLEFLDPVTNPEDKAEVWYWPRRWMGSDGAIRVWLYRDWNYVEEDGSPRNDPLPQAERQRLEGAGAGGQVELTPRADEYVKVLQFKRGGLRGYPLMTSALDWVKHHHDFLLDRVSLTSERAKWAMKVNVDGTQQQVNAVRAGVESPDPTRPSEGLRQPRAQTFVANRGVEMDPMPAVNDGVSAREDERAIRMMATMPSGIPPHLMGDVGEGNLATAAATERPFRAMLESYQGLWMEFRQEELDHVAMWLGFTGDTSVDIDAPKILGQSLLELAQLIASVAGTFPAVKRSEELLSYLLTEIGLNNVDDVIDAIRPYMEGDLEADAAVDQALEALREARQAGAGA